MKRSVARNMSLVLMLAAFPLVSIGTTGGPAWLWWAGLASLTLGGLIPAALRFVPPPEESHARPSDLDSSRVC